jgi:hypothetical protein
MNFKCKLYVSEFKINIGNIRYMKCQIYKIQNKKIRRLIKYERRERI